VAFFETFLNFTSEGILVFDKAGRLVYLNKIASEIFKIEQNKLKIKRLGKFLYLVLRKRLARKSGFLRINHQIVFNSKLEKNILYL